MKEYKKHGFGQMVKVVYTQLGESLKLFNILPESKTGIKGSINRRDCEQLSLPNCNEYSFDMMTTMQ